MLSDLMFYYGMISTYPCKTGN